MNKLVDQRRCKTQYHANVSGMMLIGAEHEVLKQGFLGYSFWISSFLCFIFSSLACKRAFNLRRDSSNYVFLSKVTNSVFDVFMVSITSALITHYNSLLHLKRHRIRDGFPLPLSKTGWGWFINFSKRGIKSSCDLNELIRDPNLLSFMFILCSQSWKYFHVFFNYVSMVWC